MTQHGRRVVIPIELQMPFVEERWLTRLIWGFRKGSWLDYEWGVLLGKYPALPENPWAARAAGLLSAPVFVLGGEKMHTCPPRVQVGSWCARAFPGFLEQMAAIGPDLPRQTAWLGKQTALVVDRKLYSSAEVSRNKRRQSREKIEHAAEHFIIGVRERDKSTDWKTTKR